MAEQVVTWALVVFGCFIAVMIIALFGYIIYAMIKSEKRFNRRQDEIDREFRRMNNDKY